MAGGEPAAREFVLSRVHEQTKVVEPGSQGRDVDDYDGEAVVEVLSEATRSDLPRECPVGRGDDSDVDGK